MQGTHVYCREIDPKNAVVSAQYNFMYNESRIGNRDNIIDRQWNYVSIGIVYDKYFCSSSGF